MAVDFWNTNTNPITGFSNSANHVNGKYQKSKVTFSRVLFTDFNPDEYIESTILAAELNIGVTKLSKQMQDIGHSRISTKGKKYYLKTHAEELRKVGIKEVVKSKLDLTWMIDSIALAEMFDVPAWIRYKVIEASGLKPVIISSGKRYYDKNKIVPFFEMHKAGTLQYKPRLRK